MKVNGLRIEQMAKDNIKAKMEECIKDSGLMISNMGLVKNLGQMGQCTKECIIKD